MVGVQQVMGFFAQRSREVFLIQRQHVGVLVGEAELIVGVQPPEDAAALIRQLAAVYDGLSAAASAAAGAEQEAADTADTAEAAEESTASPAA